MSANIACEIRPGVYGPLVCCSELDCDETA